MPSKSKPKSTAAKSQSKGIDQLANSNTKASESQKKASTSATSHSTSFTGPTGVLVRDPRKPVSDQEVENGTHAEPTVNRKKQKRRLKEAAKRAATESSNMGSKLYLQI